MTALIALALIQAGCFFYAGKLHERRHLPKRGKDGRFKKRALS